MTVVVGSGLRVTFFMEEILPLPHPYVLAVVQGLGCARFSASTVGPCEERAFRICGA